MADEILWPLRAVSKDPTNITKLDGIGNVLTSTTDLDARYVNATGDTMTGPLVVERDGAVSRMQVFCFADTGNAVLDLRKTRGTKAAQTPLVANDYLGRINFQTITSTGTPVVGATINCLANSSPTATGIDARFAVEISGSSNSPLEIIAIARDKINLRAPIVDGLSINNGINGVGVQVFVNTESGNSVNQGWGVASNVDLVTKNTACFVANNTGKGTDINTGVTVTALPEGENNWAFYSQSPAKNFLRGNLGIAVVDPTHQLEVNGTTMLRGTLDVTGNIASTGTAHSFASKSIPGMAVIGSTATAITAVTPGAAGGIRWDEDFLYIRTATAWKKIALAAI